MRMPASFLLVEDHDAWVVFEAEALFGCIDCALKHLDRHPLGWGRAQGEREEELPAARAPADRVGLVQGARKVIGHEPPDLVELDVLVLGGL